MYLYSKKFRFNNSGMGDKGHFTDFIETWSFQWNFGIFRGEIDHPLTFLVWRTEIILLKAPKADSCCSKGMHHFILLLDTNKYTYFCISLEKFQFVWMYWRQSGTSEIYVTKSVRNWQNTSYLNQNISNEQHLSCKRFSSHSTPILGLAISNIKVLASVNVSGWPSVKNLY